MKTLRQVIEEMPADDQQKIAKRTKQLIAQERMRRQVGEMLVAAAIALTLCILASLAHAQSTAVVEYSNPVGNYLGELSSTIPACVDSNLCYHLPHCQEGWVMVEVPTSTPGQTAKKCAAVGDLRDAQ